MTEREPGAIARLRALDEALARRGVPAAAVERVGRALAQHALARRFHARLRWWPMLGFVAGAALMAVLLLERRPVTVAAVSSTRPDEAASVVAAPAPAEPTCGGFTPGIARLAGGDCVEIDGIRVSAATPATITRAGDRIEVVDGEVLFEVEARPGRPLHVIAGAIDIEVVGTRFVVQQRGGVGSVALLEGRLRVRAADGEVVELAPGGRLAWPQPRAASLEPTSRPAPVEPRPRRAAPPRAPSPPQVDAGLAALLDEVAALRRAGDFQAAIDRLRTADDRGWTERSRQLVSYEVGALLERQLGDAAAACTHWHEHRRRFPGGRHDAIVARSLARLRCAAP